MSTLLRNNIQVPNVLILQLKQRIFFCRLASYDAVQLPPKIQRSPVELTKIELCGTEELLKSLEPNFKILVDFAQ